MADEIKDPLIGQTLGAYLLIEPLGHGGMASVYKAREAALERDVAVKILPQALAANDDFIQRFRREAKAVAQLNHPNIVPIYSYGEERNIIYIAMQLVEGGTLKLEDGKALAAQDALTLLAPIARALDYAHQNGIIHRDVKPSNILLARNKWPLLADFGLARTADPAQHLTASGVSMGTPMYVSPEQGRGATTDHRADIYSLGIVLYELMTGKVPFQADTPMGTIVKHITEPLPLPRKINPDIPEDVENIILKAAEKDPDDRYQTAAEMAEALETALNFLTNTATTAINARVGSAAKPRKEARVENPFTFGNPINDPARFYGRKAELRQIVNRLASSAHESTSIIGERRIGKTSLLNYLANPAAAAGLGLPPDKYCFVYVDFQGLTDITPQRFWQRILKKLSRAIADESLKPAIEKLGAQSEFDLFDLEDLFETTMDKGLSVVLLMDEFEYVTENPNFKGDFFGGLRSLAIHHGVALVPSTRRELVDLCHSDEIKGSPFFNIFANVILRPFSRAEVDELIDGYVHENDLALAQAERDLIWNLGGGYPFFAQMTGYYLVEGKSQGLAGDELAAFVLASFNQQSNPHYSHLWNYSSDGEKIMLVILLILSLQNQPAQISPVVENLTRMRVRAAQDLSTLGKRGLVIQKEDAFALFSPTLTHWIKQELLAAPGEEETAASVADWLRAENKNDLNDAGALLPRFKKKYWNIVGDVISGLANQFTAAGALPLVKSAF